MKCIELTKENAWLAESLFTGSINAKEMVYKPFKDHEAFCSFFVNNENLKVHKVSLIEETGVAFASGCYVEGEERAYITIIIVNPQKRRQGIGSNLLQLLEKRLCEIGGVKRLEIIFFNPMTLSWFIPGGNGADHPNAPGIDRSSEAYLFFKKCGYRDYAVQNSYYIDLEKYHIPNSMKEQLLNLEKEGITFEEYNSTKHHGLNEMMHQFGNPMWEREILEEVGKGKQSRPILIVSHNGKTVGFTGPLDVEKSGRGYFAGIGVDEAYRGKGIAKVLFCKLCLGLKEKGASFMTLFTGANNPARNIYEAAGFSIVKTWVDMRKEG